MEPTPPPSGSAHPDDDELLDLAHSPREPGGFSETLAHLKQCPSCENRFRLFASERARLLTRPGPRLTSAGIELAAPLTLAVAGGASEAGAVGSLVSRLFRRPVVGLGLAAAAFLIVLFTLRPGSAPKREAYWLPPPTEEALRSDSGIWASSPEVARALEAYARHDVAGALARFRSIAPDQTSDYFDSLRALYLASLLVNSGEDLEAQKLLSALDIVIMPEPWRGRARYLLQLTYRHQGRAAAADSLLEVLAGQPGELGERARRELGR